MTRTISVTVLSILIVGVLVLFTSVVTVTQTQQAVVLQFGAVKRTINEPGLDFITPFVQTVRYFDKRILPLESDPEEVITSDRKRIVVDAFARFRISDPVKYLQSSPNEDAARQRLLSLMNSSLRGVLGSQNFSALLSGERERLMREIRDQMQAGARDLGIDIVDVRIRRADLPVNNQNAVFQRMQAERQQEAEKYRSEGDAEAQRITADADRQATVIRAEATQKSDILRGEGEAERNRILGEAYGRDPDFFEFYRSLKAYEASMNGSNTTMVVSPDSPFFRYFQRGASGTK